MSKEGFLNRDSQRKRLNRAIGIAGQRYTPELNIELPLNLLFDGIGRTPPFFNRLNETFGRIRRAYRSCQSPGAYDVAGIEYDELRASMTKVFPFLEAIDQVGSRQIDFNQLRELLTGTMGGVWKCLHVLQKAKEERKLNGQEQPPPSTHREGFSSERHYLIALDSELHDLSTFCESKEATLANNPWLLLTGVSGTGKTHLFCDIAKNRIDNDLPTFIFLGEEFNQKDPWLVIKGLLGVCLSRDEFLTAIDRHASKTNTRAILMIDALNEQQVGVNWSLLNVFRRHKNIALALSVRTGFEKHVLGGGFLKSFIREEHKGFEYREWEAVRKFFTAFNLPLPEVPLLRPEFHNPAFLLLFCKGVSQKRKMSKRQAFRGHEGATFIFEQFVKNTADQIAKEFGIKAGRDRQGQYAIWDNIIEKIAERMGSRRVISGRISERDALRVIQDAYPGIDSRRMLASLERNYLLTKVARYSKDYQPIGYEYRFPFQKFSDHLIVRYLLKKHLDKKDPRRSFRPRARLGKILQGYWNRGLVEALAIQVPERLKGKDLVFLAPRSFRGSPLAQETFIESLIWRDPSLKDGKPKSFNVESALKYINAHIIRTREGHDQLLEAFLTVAAIPEHPFNARLLHSHLVKFKLPRRDSWWLPFLYRHYSEEAVINRLITWAWKGGDKSQVSDDAIDLAGTALAWFLTSSHRFLRDRATKGLVALLTNRSKVLARILRRFNGVDDPYLTERLYAVAYGCSLRSQDGQALRELARCVYDLVFKNGRPPVHILLRDYARGVIETALYRGVKFEMDDQKIRPPYKSTWPSRIMSEKSLKSYDRTQYGLIWNSLLYNHGGFPGDFGNYVVNSALGHWSSFRLDIPRPPTPQEIYDGFVKTLTPEQQKLWEMRRATTSRLLIRMIQDQSITQEEVLAHEKEEDEGEEAFFESLTEQQRKIYVETIKAYEKSNWRAPGLDYAAAQRWIFQRVIELGWEPGSFKEFDASISSWAREARKNERIGKKYQWIAFHELLARVADNFEFRKDRWSEGSSRYEGPWQLWIRDIDPSCLLERMGGEDKSEQRPWWFSVGYDAWERGLSDSEWIRRDDDVPQLSDLIEVTGGSGRGWLVLEGSFRWEESHPPEEEKYEKPRRDLWLMVKSYLVGMKDIENAFNWATEQDFFGRWMPESHPFISIFLREFPWAQSYLTSYGGKSWTIETRSSERMPTKVLVTDEEYLEERGFDCSIESPICIKLPARWLHDAMQLRPSEIDGAYSDGRGLKVAFDPSVQEAGPGVLLIDKQSFIEFLSSKGYEVFWTVLGEKLVIGGEASAEHWPGTLKISGAYRLNSEGKLTGKFHTKFVSPAHET